MVTAERVAVVTGGGSGMGRELVRQLVAEGCAIAMCDVSARGMAETQRLCTAAGKGEALQVSYDEARGWHYVGLAPETWTAEATPCAV